MYLCRVDRIVVVNNGSIAEVGTYEELMNAGMYHLFHYLLRYLTSEMQDWISPRC